MGMMNSTWAQYALKLVNPTVHVQVGDLARLPIPNHDSDTLRELVSHATALARADSAEDETTYEFIAPPRWADGMARVAARHTELARIEGEIDEEVYRLYGIGAADRAAIEAELAAPVEEDGPATHSRGTDADAMNGEDDGASEDGTGDFKSLVEGAETADLMPVETARRDGAGKAELAARWVSYAVGIALGRFQPGIAGALGSGVVASDAGVYAGIDVPAPEGLAAAPIAPEVGEQLRALAVPDGIATLDPGHHYDLTARVTRALGLLVGEDQVEGLIAAAAGGRPLAEWLARDFFKDHLKRYRKRPIYWLLQSPKRRYGVYLFSERVTRDTLHLLRGGHYLAGRAARLREEATRLRARIKGLAQGGERRRAERELEGLDAELADLELFDKALAAATTQPNARGETAGWAPELDDGILINLAPLHALLPAWSAEPKQAWAALERGEYDWSHTAMRYWPDRVLAKCRENKSYAIAHGVEAEATATT